MENYRLYWDALRHFQALQEKNPLTGTRAHMRWCGVRSAFARGVIGNTAWSRSMRGKHCAKYRWKRWAMRRTRQERGGGPKGHPLFLKN